MNIKKVFIFENIKKRGTDFERKKNPIETCFQEYDRQNPFTADLFTAC